MAGARLIAPAAQFVRAASSAAPVSKSAALLAGAKAAAPLSRKYADLLKERNIDPDHPRHLYTRSSNRPHPPPRTMRLMQTFTTNAPREAPADVTMDNVVFPGSASLRNSSKDAFAQRIPLLPDNFTAHYGPEVAGEPATSPQISIVAANPELVLPASITEVEGIDVDGAEFSGEAQDVFSDLRKGLDGVLSSKNSKGNISL
ncbi:hypothetical protein GGS23DRAFT_600701 [Durotheca rogersii]|uniref:uncharacterized protein n=1 Tax=Durotheca rogersii TaxID=419775 RepID=UPI00221F1988|nr:uncharacterized protein GGS23DRAFT_600701 [Durotheca rogersii]KAI5858206.1 hypothetical protein GGS23DRAFT_600701 [Durotheca rogersii]